MKTRIIAGCCMLPLLLVIYFGGWILWAFDLVIGIMAVYEFYRGFREMNIKPSLPIGIGGAVLLYALNLVACGGRLGDELDYKWLIVWFFACVIASLLYLFRIEERKLEDGMVTLTGLFYCVFFSFHITLIDQMTDYSILIWLVFITAFGTDVCAYFAGVTLGKHKLCPKISPKKSIEGSVGGILGSTVLSIVFACIFAEEFLVHCIVIGVLGGVISQFGDLTASIFKRKMGIKDYGKLIPGHGGIMDRFDSVLFTGPMVFYYILLVLE
ncbi:MAG: phosphatidate cytidylyltransferase [Anaerovoracaceae bacterium]